MTIFTRDDLSYCKVVRCLPNTPYFLLYYVETIRRQGSESGTLLSTWYGIYVGGNPHLLKIDVFTPHQTWVGTGTKQNLVLREGKRLIGVIRGWQACRSRYFSTLTIFVDTRFDDVRNMLYTSRLGQNNTRHLWRGEDRWLVVRGREALRFPTSARECPLPMLVLTIWLICYTVQRAYPAKSARCCSDQVNQRN